jgi:hypothetical protein
MKIGKMPFQFDVSDLLAKARRTVVNQIGDVTLNLPFISFSVNPVDREKKIARELVIRLQDRRVLSSTECCDGCIDKSLKSLQEIRAILIDKQVELANAQDGPLYLLVEMMALGIRQFVTFEELLTRGDLHSGDGDFYRRGDERQSYFDGLEILRGHLHHCLTQVATMAGTSVARDGIIKNYDGPWQLEAYKRPESERDVATRIPKASR